MIGQMITQFLEKEAKTVAKQTNYKNITSTLNLKVPNRGIKNF
jgi:hypothetical protein